jgi:hypothetical protein
VKERPPTSSTSRGGVARAAVPVLDAAIAILPIGGRDGAPLGAICSCGQGRVKGAVRPAARGRSLNHEGRSWAPREMISP